MSFIDNQFFLTQNGLCNGQNILMYNIYGGKIYIYIFSFVIANISNSKKKIKT